MDGINFDEVLKSYESEVEDEDYDRADKTSEEIKVIANDVRRTRLISVNDDDENTKKLLKHIMYKTLVSLPNKYTQGMSEISSVFVIYYMYDVASANNSFGSSKITRKSSVSSQTKEMSSVEEPSFGLSESRSSRSSLKCETKMSKSSVPTEGSICNENKLSDGSKLSTNSSFSKESRLSTAGLQGEVGDEKSGEETELVEECGTFDDELVLTVEERSRFQEFINTNQELYDKLRIVLSNVFRRRFDPLVTNEFTLYNQYNSVFIQMMKNRKVKIDKLESHRFMSSIFTFFLRNLSNIDDIYKVFSIILFCPNTCPFIMLVIYYDRITSGLTIENVDDDLYKKVMELENEFVATQESIKRPVSGFTLKHALLIGGAISIAVIAYLYKSARRE